MPFSRFLRSRTSLASDLLKSVGGAVLSRLITAASLPILTHIYAPLDFGIWPLLLAFSGFLYPLATLRYEIAVVLAKSRRVAISLVWVILLATAFVSAIAFLGLVAIGPRTASALVGLDVIFGASALIIPVIIALRASQAALIAWLTRTRHFQGIATSQIAQAAITAVASILLAWLFEPSAAMIVAGSLIGLAAALAVTMWAARRTSLRFPAAQRSFTATWNAMRRHKVYPIYTVPYTISSGLSDRIFQILLASLFSVSVLGVYYVARQIVYSPMTMLTAALRQVVFAHSVGNVDARLRKALIGRVLGQVADMGTPIVAFSLFWFPIILERLIGPGWIGIGDFAFWSILPAGMGMLTNWLDRALDVIGRQRLSLVLQITLDLVLLGVILASIWYGATAVEVVAAMSCAIAVYNALWLGITLRLLGFSGREILVFGGKIALLLAACCGVYWGIMNFTSSIWDFALSLCFLGLSMAIPIRRALRPEMPIHAGGQ